MEKVLVTGATGFLGNYVIDALMKRPLHIVTSSATIEKAVDHFWYGKLDYRKLNVNDSYSEKDIYDYFGKPDRVIHLAWEGLPNYKDEIHLEKVLPAQKKFLTALLRGGLKDLTVTGTCFEYGLQEGELSEDMPAEPVTIYGKAKHELLTYLMSLQNKFHYSLKWVRLFYMFGKGQNEHSLYSQLDKAIEQDLPSFDMSGGQQIRDFLPVQTVAEHLVNISLQNDINGIINCGSGRPVSVEDFVRELLRSRNSNITLNLGHYPYSNYEPMSFWSSTEKLKSII